ncbi:MAG TPA: hypothetical protein VLC09_17950, partial [Polyangiaceae bacterium]|nr:hypothetical protein [Polyangiaceae bacterium]
LFWSSLFVFGSARGRVGEGELRVGQSFAHPHDEVCAVAERIVRHAASLAPLAVVRSAPLQGEAGRRRSFADSALAQLVAAVERAPARSEIWLEPKTVRLETSERVARALLASWRAQRVSTANLVDVNAPSSLELLDWIGERKDREFLPPLPGSRPRSRRTPFDDVAEPERRVVAGWDLEFERTTALELFPELLDPSPRELVDRLIDAVDGTAGGAGAET